MYLTGYRIAMIVAGAGSLWIASFLETEIYNQKVWQQVYQIMALLMLFGVLTVLYSSEPILKKNLIKKLNFLLLF
jgi:PAT family beta-lactamase induction signal transducer AmpG